MSLGFPKGSRMESLFVTAVEAIYAAAPNPALWPTALQAIADILGDVGAVMIYGRDDGLFGAVDSPSIDAMVRDFTREFNGADLRAIRGVERGIFLARDSATDRDVVTDEEIRTHPYYQLMARHGLRYFGAAPIFQDFRMNTAISVQRALDRDPYTTAELQIIERVARHVETSLRLSMRLFNAELVKDGLGAALGRLNIGVFALDTLGRVTYSNPVGDGLLGDGIHIVDQRLWVSNAGERISVASAIGRIVGDPAGHKPILVPRVRSERALVMYLLPLSIAKPEEEFLTHARAIVLVIDPRTDEPADPSVVREVLGLTLGEARVAALVGSGLAPREAAERLGITEETTRTALKRVFSKVGVSRQSELVALLAKLVLKAG